MIYNPNLVQCICIKSNGKRCKQQGKPQQSGGSIIDGYCRFHKKFVAKVPVITILEPPPVQEIVEQPKAHFYLCDDILEMVGVEVVKKRVEWKATWGVWINHHNALLAIVHNTLNTMVEALEKRKKPLTIKNMRYKYIGYALRHDYQGCIWHWSDTLKVRNAKIQVKAQIYKQVIFDYQHPLTHFHALEN